MIINHNLNAMNAHRQLGITNSSSSKSMEKLSSGLRINRAGDDAAGLAISEKMRAQIRGLNMASKNAQDGISLIQTAEGALQETHSILQRMRELAVQSANDTNIAVDRSEIQKEMNELIDEIDRIATQTQFNEQNLLDGTFTGKKFHIGANAAQDVTLNINAMTSGASGATSFHQLTGSGAADTNFSEGNTAAVTIGDTTVTLDDDYTDIDGVIDALNAGFADTGIVFTEDSGVITISGAEGFSVTVVEADASAATLNIADGDATSNVPAGLELGSGSGGGLGVGSLKVEGVTKDSTGGIMTQEGASAAITTIQSAIETVSAERSKLGAMQNRLEYTIKNLDNTSENLQAAESRIRDVDMAKEMMEFTKNNILQQAAQAMLAQANQAPQGVLQLLR